MSYYADTVLRHVERQLDGAGNGRELGNKLILVLPSLPVQVAVPVCLGVEELCANRPLTARPLIKIAAELCRDWERDPELSSSFRMVKEKGWRDEAGNLTLYRNQPPTGQGLFLVLVIGVDRVTDAASLADFHHCDYATLWRQELKESFGDWIRWRAKASSVELDESTVRHMDEVLMGLFRRGLADGFRISQLVEAMSLDSSTYGRDAQRQLLSGLHALGLPSFAGYASTRRRPFIKYLDEAVAFFSYDSLIEARQRKKALEGVRAFQETHRDGGYDPIDPSAMGSYGRVEDLLSDLQIYIESKAYECRERLRECDFVTLLDRILQATPDKDSSSTKEKVRKLLGGPLEVVLTALLQTLHDFKRLAKDRGAFALLENITAIDIESTVFKHDCDGATREEREESAQSHLRWLVGGVDSLVAEWVSQASTGREGAMIKVGSRLLHPDVNYQSSNTAEPCLCFTVRLFGPDNRSWVQNRFSWGLPASHPYRVARELLSWAKERVEACGDDCLPVFHVPYYDELLLSNDEDETGRVLSLCVQGDEGAVINLLRVDGVDRSDGAISHFEKLARVYATFLREACDAGLHVALRSCASLLSKAYEEAASVFLSGASAPSPLVAHLFRAFFVVGDRATPGDQSWTWNSFEPSAVVTLLHPALIEMLTAQIDFLLTAFYSVVMRELKSSAERSFDPLVWQGFVDLAAIRTPVCGLLRDRNKTLTTDVAGMNLVHRIGSRSADTASLTTRLLLRYDGDDEDPTDKELFRQTREERVILGVLVDYHDLYPHADDGMAISVYENHTIQPFIAAVDRYLRDLAQTRGEDRPRYSMRVTVFTESSDDTSIARWITDWRSRLATADVDTRLEHYRRVHLTVAHRIVPSGDGYKQFAQAIRVGAETDVAILSAFVTADTQGNDFVRVDPYDVTSRTLKFPLLEKPMCSSAEPGQQNWRRRVLSNRQFRVGALHTELMARLKNPSTAPSENHVVIGFGDYSPWRDVVTAFHERAAWVVCIDPNVDEKLLTLGATSREIIGFGSGVGTRGESNYTISTEKFSLADLLRRLTLALGEIFLGWGRAAEQDVAKGILNEVKHLAGLSVVRATGVGAPGLRDLIAYAITRKILKSSNLVLCDVLVSLDAYRHWFETADSEMRPDLLWIVADIDETGRVRLDLRLVECKLAQESDAHTEKARRQLEAGLRHLVSLFKPKSPASTEEEQPDQRYWWLQLHRLIASRSIVKSQDEACALMALERLAEGDFSVEWRAIVLTYWTDFSSSRLQLSGGWDLELDGQTVRLGVVSTGPEFLKTVATAGFDGTVPWPETAIRFNSREGDAANTPGSRPEPINETDVDVGLVGTTISQTLSGTEATETPPVASARLDGLLRPMEPARPDSESVEASPPAPVSLAIPDRILLGTTPDGARKVYWEFGHKDLTNRHLLIFGLSGMGKSYTIQCLLCELARLGQSSLIIDYTNSFLPNQLESETRAYLRPEQHIVRQEPLPISPFRFQTTDLGTTVLPESTSTAAKRIAAIFQAVYDLGEQQFSVLFDALNDGLQNSGDQMCLEVLQQTLENFAGDPTKNRNAALTTLSKIRPFVLERPFGAAIGEHWSSIFEDPEHRSHVFQLAGFDTHTWRLVAEFVLWDLFAYLQAHGQRTAPKILVLDEVQNLDQKESGPLAKYLREGRKFGVSLVLATQIMSNLDRSEKDRLFNAAHKLFFRPVDTEMKTYADILTRYTGEKSDIWQKRISSLQKGECYSVGSSLNEAKGCLEVRVQRIRITPLSDRSLPNV